MPNQARKPQESRKLLHIVLTVTTNDDCQGWAHQFCFDIEHGKPEIYTV